jgi:hypothetical protein
MLHFLRWQSVCNGTDVIVEINRNILSETKGRDIPVVFHDEQKIAVGFISLMHYWENHGLFLV